MFTFQSKSYNKIYSMLSNANSEDSIDSNMDDDDDYVIDLEQEYSDNIVNSHLGIAWKVKFLFFLHFVKCETCPI